MTEERSSCKQPKYFFNTISCVIFLIRTVFKFLQVCAIFHVLRSYIIINNNNTLYYSVKSSSKATQSLLIGDMTLTTTPALAYSYRQVCGLF